MDIDSSSGAQDEYENPPGGGGESPPRVTRLPLYLSRCVGTRDPNASFLSYCWGCVLAHSLEKMW